MAEKATKLEVQERIDYVYELLLRGVVGPEIVKICHKKFGVSKVQVYYYIQRAKEHFIPHTPESIQEKKDFHIAFRKRLIRMALSGRTEDVDGKPTVVEALTLSQKIDKCLAIAQDLAKLEGLYTEKVLMLHADVGDAIKEQIAADFHLKLLGTEIEFPDAKPVDAVFEDDMPDEEEQLIGIEDGGNEDGQHRDATGDIRESSSGSSSPRG